MKETPYSILVVDDEPANVRLLARMLRDSYVVREAQGGAEALRIASGEDKPALILLDVMMPEIDGFEVCRRLKACDDTKDIMVIFVTAMGDSAAEEVGLNLGAVDYITKPLRLPIVRARVRNHMNVRKKADMLEAMSYIDGLTHAHNRRRFDMALRAEWQRGRRSRQSLAVIMIDFDHFKALNDHYGHGTGDICLQQGAAALTDTLQRSGDLLARYGGEEFVALLPDTGLDGARAKAEEMRLAVKALRLAHEYSSAADHVTVSLGVAASVPSASFDAGQLLELADRALGRAKAEGRDRVCVAASPWTASVEQPPPPTDRDPERRLDPPSAPAAATAAESAWRSPAGATDDDRPDPAMAPVADCASMLPMQRRGDWLALVAAIGVTLNLLRDTELNAEQRHLLDQLGTRIGTLHSWLKALPRPETAPPPPPVTEAPIARQRSSARILLVEDNRANQVVTKAMLRKLGYPHVELASQGAQALERLAQARFDLVLLDCRMPTMDGLATARRIRARAAAGDNAQVPIIALGAHASQENRQRCRAAGMNAYVPKPLDMNRLAIVMREQLGRAGVSPTVETSAADNAVPDARQALFLGAELLERVGQDREIAAAVIEQFLTDMPRRIDELRAGLDAGDLDQVQFKAHSIKGLAANLSALGLHGLAVQLEGAGHDLARVAILVARLSSEFDDLAPALRDWLRDSGAD